MRYRLALLKASDSAVSGVATLQQVIDRQLDQRIERCAQRCPYCLSRSGGIGVRTALWLGNDRIRDPQVVLVLRCDAHC